jgi:hypothetical protein
MSMAVHVFTNHLIYDSILRRTRLSAQRGTCPVAKKAIFKNCESNQCVICLANANFGLGRLGELTQRRTELEEAIAKLSDITALQTRRSKQREEGERRIAVAKDLANRTQGSQNGEGSPGFQ